MKKEWAILEKFRLVFSPFHKKKNKTKQEVSSTNTTLLLLLSLLSDIGACWRTHTHTGSSQTLGLRKASLSESSEETEDRSQG